MTRRVDVVDALDQVEAPEDGQVAIVPEVSDHRDGVVFYTRWIRVSGRWVDDGLCDIGVMRDRIPQSAETLELVTR